MNKIPQAMQTMLVLSAAQSVANKKIDRSLSIHGLSFSEFLVMHQLVNAPQQMMSRIALAEATHRTASGITRLLNPMEKNHWVEKEKNSRDARISLVKLTPSGLQLYRDAFTSCTSVSESLCSNMTDKQVSSLSGLLAKVQ